MEYKYFAFLDVLGYKSNLDADKKSGKQEFLEKLKKSFGALDDIDTGIIQIKSVSDSIFIHSNGRSSGDFILFLKTLRALFNSFLKNGLLIRGGVAWDEHFQNDRITYSYALIEAYLLESQKAITPRILIHKSIIEKSRNEDWLNELINNNLLIKDGQDIHLHIFDDENWNNIYDWSKKIYESDLDKENISSSAKIKHIWLEDYIFHNKPSGAKRKHYIKRWEKIS